jgi:hypothetical protein
MSIEKLKEGLYRVRLRGGGRERSVRIRGSAELTKNGERKTLSLRDENRHLDVKLCRCFRASLFKRNRYFTALVKPLP